MVRFSIQAFLCPKLIQKGKRYLTSYITWAVVIIQLDLMSYVAFVILSQREDKKRRSSNLDSEKCYWKIYILISGGENAFKCRGSEEQPGKSLSFRPKILYGAGSLAKVSGSYTCSAPHLTVFGETVIVTC